jgi:GGDEF domain-containing protein
MMLLDDQRRVLALNRTLERWTGVRSEEVQQRPVFCGDIIGCRDMGRSGESETPGCPGLLAAAEGREVPWCEYTLRSATGTDIRVCASYIPAWDEATGRQWIVAILRDVSLQKKTRLSLRSHEDRDPVTGLLGGFGLLEASRDELRRSERLHRPFALVRFAFPDLLFREDSDGPLAAHAVLQRLVSILRGREGQRSILAHSAPAELSVLLRRAGEDEAVAFVADVAPELKAELSLASSERAPQIETEVAVFPRDGATAEDLLAAAHVRTP